jgi:superfamily II DNA or RNA helicase
MDLQYFQGTIAMTENIPEFHPIWNPKIQQWLLPGCRYYELIQYLQNHSILYTDRVFKSDLSLSLQTNLRLRGYQHIGMRKWEKFHRGIIIMPTGSGKTALAIKLMERMQIATLIVVPTLDLLHQWKEQLNFYFKIDIGEFSGQKKVLESITVTTYDSAYINANFLGNRFKLLIFDEVHHLASPNYMGIAEIFASPYRLGLTATLEREDGSHQNLYPLIGKVVYEVKRDHLVGKFLAPYKTERIYVDLTDEERKKYNMYQNIYSEYLKLHNLTYSGMLAFKRVLMRSGKDPAAREAIHARLESELIAFNSQSKIDLLATLLQPEQRTIIFTKYNEMVYHISHRYFIPCITHQISKQEREDILRKFREGTYKIIVASQILDEGIDVPEASIGIVLSGTGSKRSHIQRLGRLLRPKAGKEAILYEIISRNTKESGTSYRRANGVTSNSP